MADIQGILRGFQEALERAEELAEALPSQVDATSIGFGALATERGASALALRQGIEDTEAATEGSRTAAEQGQSHVEAAFMGLQEAKDASVATIHSAALAVKASADETSERTQQYLDDVQSRVEEYAEALADRTEQVVKGLSACEQTSSSLGTTAGCIRQHLGTASGCAERSASLRGRLAKDERRIHAIQLNAAGCRELQRDDVDAALGCFQAAHESDPAPEVLFNLALCLCLRGDAEGSSAALRSLGSAGLPAPVGHRLHSLVALHGGDIDEARKAAEEAVALDPRDVCAWLIAAIANLGSGSAARALRCLQQARAMPGAAALPWEVLENMLRSMPSQEEV